MSGLLRHEWQRLTPWLGFSPQPLLVMWKTGGVVHHRTVDNLSGPVENSVRGQL